MNRKIVLSEETYELLLDIVGDTGEYEGGDDVIKRIAKFYLKEKLGPYWETVKEK